MNQQTDMTPVVPGIALDPSYLDALHGATDALTRIMDLLPTDTSSDRVKAARELAHQMVTSELRDLPPRMTFREPGRYSMSFLRSAERCMYRAVVERAVGTVGPPARLGTIVHEIAERLVRELLDSDQTVLDADEAEARAGELLASMAIGLPLQADQYATVMRCVRGMASAFALDPDAQLVLTEMPFETDLDDITHSARVDVIQVRDKMARIDDWKTSMRVPSQDEFERQVQTPVYAWHVARKFPWVDEFEIGEVYVRYGVRRSTVLYREDIAQVEKYLATQANRMRTAYECGQFEPAPGDHCGTCPVSMLCPVPRAAIPELAVTDDDGAQRLVEWVAATESALRGAKTALKARVEHEEAPIEAGGLVADFRIEERERVDKEGLRAALAANAVDPEPYFTKSKSTRFGLRKRVEG